MIPLPSGTKIWLVAGITAIMLTRLREIVEKVASAPRLNEALNILVTDICLAMALHLF